MKTAKKNFLIAFIATLLYAIGMVVGLLVICVLPQRIEQSHYTYFVNQLAQEYSKKHVVENWGYSGLATVVYGPDGSFYDFDRMESDLFSISFVEETENEVSNVLSGECTVRFFPLVKNNSSLSYASRLVMGVPVVLENGETAAFFWIREMPDLPAILLSYMISFTVIFVIALIIVIINLHNQNKLREFQKQYVDNITHELKSPVASIKALTEALSDGMEKDELDRNIYYGMILRETSQQQHMIQEALTLSKLQTRSVRIGRVPVDPWEILEPLRDKYEPLCDLMNVEFTISTEFKEFGQFYTDKESIVKILSVLIDNAVKYMPEGGGRIDISAVKIHQTARMCVSDNGRGINKKDQKYIFERFYRPEHTDNATGSGLGLAIARELTDKLHEKIWVESAPGKGTRMYFTVALTENKRSFGNNQ